MPQLLLELQPNKLNAIGPTYMKWLIAFSLASITTYYALTNLDLASVQSNSRLAAALILTTLLGSTLAIKPKLIHLHNTKYDFYDTHVNAQTGFFKKHRDSMPYKQISKLTNNENLWDRLTNASDITLHSSRPGEDQGLTLRSIKNSNEVEEQIYRLLKEKKNEE